MKKLVNIFGGAQSGFIGLWWYSDEYGIWPLMKSLEEASNDGIFLQYDTNDNHLTKWKDVVTSNIEDKDAANTLIAKGYKSLERGRVLYDIRTQSYTILCSEAVSKNVDIIRLIVDTFNIPKGRYDILQFRAKSPLL